MSRYSPYITKPPTHWQQQINELNSTRLFLVSTLGPTVFILKGNDMTEATFKVFIGERQMCSCGGGEGRGKLCVHLLFVMIKVLKVSKDNPISWQLSLVDSEIDSVLSDEVNARMISSKQNDGTYKSRTSTHKYLKKGEGITKRRKDGRHFKSENGRHEGKDSSCKESAEVMKPVARRELDEDNVCSICQEEFTVNDFENDLLCYCEVQCGTNFHKKCFRMYAAYNKSEKKSISCPICRSIWNKVPNLPIKKESYGRIRSFFGKNKKCQGCQMKISDEVYRCVSCNFWPPLDLCSRCFEIGNPIQKPQLQNDIYVKADLRKMPSAAVEWKVAERRCTASSSLQSIDHQSLLYREFTSSDYDLLLALGNHNSTPPLHQHLLRALRVVPKEEKEGDKVCCICSGSMSSSHSIRYLPCRFDPNHVAHESCIVNLLIEAQTSRTFGNVGAQCPTCQNKSWFFPMLADDPTTATVKGNIKKKKSNLTNAYDDIENNQKIKKEAFTCNEALHSLCILGTSSTINAAATGRMKINFTKARRRSDHKNTRKTLQIISTKSNVVKK